MTFKAPVIIVRQQTLEISVLKAIYLAPVPLLIIGITAHNGQQSDRCRTYCDHQQLWILESIGFNFLREK
jgi:hypothetical protein